MKLVYYRRWFRFRGGAFFLLLLAIPSLTVFLLSYLARFYGEDSRLNFIGDTQLLMTINYFEIFVIFFFIKKFTPKSVDFFDSEHWFHSLGKALIPSIISFGAGFVILMLLITIVELLPFPEFLKNWMSVSNQGFIEIFNQISGKNHLRVLLWFFYISVLAPFSEEIIFRGYLQDMVEKNIKKYNIDIIITALIYSIFHINSLSNAIYSFIIGFFLSYYRKKTGYINVSIWIHCLINFTGLIYGIIANYYL